MIMYNLKETKTKLRQQYKASRRVLANDEKQRRDEKIRERILRLSSYRQAGAVLCYVSAPLEVNTLLLISQMLEEGKRVAAPRCIPGAREMEFYYIDSLSALLPGAFSILEPVPEASRLFHAETPAICLVPGFCFDKYGYRLGYGKGYYDRFLSGFSGAKLGLCYHENLIGELPRGRYDCRVDTVVTERNVMAGVRNHTNSK